MYLVVQLDSKSGEELCSLDSILSQDIQLPGLLIVLAINLILSSKTAITGFLNKSFTWLLTDWVRNFAIISQEVKLADFHMMLAASSASSKKNLVFRNTKATVKICRLFPDLNLQCCNLKSNTCSITLHNRTHSSSIIMCTI